MRKRRIPIRLASSSWCPAALLLSGALGEHGRHGEDAAPGPGERANRHAVASSPKWSDAVERGRKIVRAGSTSRTCRDYRSRSGSVARSCGPKAWLADLEEQGKVARDTRFRIGMRPWCSRCRQSACCWRKAG